MPCELLNSPLALKAEIEAVNSKLMQRVILAGSVISTPWTVR